MPGPRSGGGAEPPRALFERYLEQIEEVVTWVSRRFAMGADEAEEFRSRVHLKLIEGDYRVLRSFSGRSGMATYLTTVIQNLARDYRTSRWGRWRPSAAAERLGLVAVQLETLLERDGFSFAEAAEILRANHGVRRSRTELAQLAARMPARVRPRFEGDADIAATASDSRADRAARRAEGRQVLERARTALAAALAELDVEDRLVLKLHYQSGLTIAAVAAALDLDQRRLYTRRDRCRRRLRASLEGRGLVAAEVLEALGWVEGDFEVDYGLEEQELGGTEPSNHTGEGDRKRR